MSQAQGSQMQSSPGQYENVNADDALKTLEKVVQNANALLTQLHGILSQIHKNTVRNDRFSKSPSPSFDAPPAPALAQLHGPTLARDSASLISAHVTKLSLLIVNEPFTPSAIITVIRQLSGEPLAGLVTAVRISASAPSPKCIRRELAWRSLRIVCELHSLFAKIPLDGNVVPRELRACFTAPEQGGRGSLPTTGLILVACRDLVSLANEGVQGYYVREAEQWKDLLVDVMDELRHWGQESPRDDADLELPQNPSTQDVVDQVMNSYHTIPSDDPNRIRPRLEMSLKRMRLVSILYEALIKRRLKELPDIFAPATAPATVDTIGSRLDEMALSLERVHNDFEELAGAFYELESQGIDNLMDQCFFNAFALSELFVRDWQGSRDGFSTWIEKFQDQMKTV